MIVAINAKYQIQDQCLIPRTNTWDIFVNFYDIHALVGQFARFLVMSSQKLMIFDNKKCISIAHKMCMRLHTYLVAVYIF